MRIPTRLPAIDFGWSPTLGDVTFTVGGDVFPPDSDARFQARTTAINTLISFTSEIDVPPGNTIAEIKWDFGDGYVAFGPVASHTFVAANPTLAVALIVTDGFGRERDIAKILSLRAP